LKLELTKTWACVMKNKTEVLAKLADINRDVNDLSDLIPNDPKNLDLLISIANLSSGIVDVFRKVKQLSSRDLPSE